MPSRIELLQRFIAERPTDPFPCYALAMEHKNGGDFEAARKVFATLAESHRDYVPAYLHAGQVLLALGHTAEAEATFRTGIEVCARQGDVHARGELEGALAQLTSS